MNIPRVTNEGWNSQKHLPGHSGREQKEKTLVSSSKALTKYSKVDVARKKNGVLIIHLYGYIQELKMEYIVLIQFKFTNW